MRQGDTDPGFREIKNGGRVGQGFATDGRAIAVNARRRDSGVARMARALLKVES